MLDLLGNQIDTEMRFTAVLSEMNGSRAVLHNVRSIALALPGDRIERHGVNVQLPVQLFGLHGHVAIQPQQIKPNNAPHAHPRFRRRHYRDRVTSQLRSAA